MERNILFNSVICLCETKFINKKESILLKSLLTIFQTVTPKLHQGFRKQKSLHEIWYFIQQIKTCQFPPFNTDVIFSPLLFVNLFIQRLREVLIAKISWIRATVVDMGSKCLENMMKWASRGYSENSGYMRRVVKGGRGRVDGIESGGENICLGSPNVTWRKTGRGLNVCEQGVTYSELGYQSGHAGSHHCVW